MQRRSCEKIQFLLSKYADNEATPHEREKVDRHIALCEVCYSRLAEYLEAQAIFSKEVPRSAEPQLRAGLYREIAHLKEEARREEIRATEEREGPWYLPVPAPQSSPNQPSFALRLLKAVSPFAAACAAVFAFFGLIVMGGRLPGNAQPTRTAVTSMPPLFVPTKSAAIFNPSSTNGAPEGQVPPPVLTAAANNVVPVASVSVTVYATAAFEGVDTVLRLARPTPVFEAGDAAKGSTWHVMRDPAYNYKIAYPPNWWTRTTGSWRYFYHWGPGGTRYAPYWIDLRVNDNPEGLTIETANERRFKGQGEIVRGENGKPAWLRHSSSSEDNLYDELYTFTAAHIYSLRLVVPKTSNLGGFQGRFEEAQAIFSRMSGNVSFASDSPKDTPSYDQVFFLNGTDLWSLSASGKGATAITRGYGVSAFATSPDLRQIALLTKKEPTDAWANHIYLAHTEPDSTDSTRLLWPGTSDGAWKVHDTTWYSDRELLALAENPQGALGLYAINLGTGDSAADTAPQAELLVQLNDGTAGTKGLSESMAGAKGLAVSPDRQLITFLAPLGSDQKTDIYAVRPDGSDLRSIVSHADPVAVSASKQRVLSPDSQAIKSYLWMGGSLEMGGYVYNILFTCGNSYSPTLDKGGLLYAAPGVTRGPALAPDGLGVADPAKMQIVHLAYSPNNKLAFTGYYIDYNGRADQLAGLWTANVSNGTLNNLRPQSLPKMPDGITDLQWSPDGNSLIYRETMPADLSDWSSRYDGHSPFRMMKLDPSSLNGQPTVLYNGAH